MFQIGSVLLLMAIWLAEIYVNKLHWPKYQTPALLSGAAFIGYLPLLFQALYNPEFWVRFQQKTAEGAEIPLLVKLVVNSSKYFSLDFLWLRGEIFQPGAFITRHGLLGLGLYPWILLGAILALLFGWSKLTSKEKTFVLPLWIFWWLAPLGGLLTTNVTSAPYSFALIPQLITIPLLTSAGWLVMTRWLQNQKVLVSFVLPIVGISLLFSSFFVLQKAVSTYALQSADYWGWQYGMKEIVSHAQAESKQFNQVIISSMFNQPATLFEFYNQPAELCTNCVIGGFDRYDSKTKQLFILRTEEIDQMTQEQKIPSMHTIQTFYLPDGTAAFQAFVLSAS